VISLICPGTGSAGVSLWAAAMGSKMGQLQAIRMKYRQPNPDPRNATAILRIEAQEEMLQS
jgi:hypothetical protein